jgi:hypothetical protein
MTVLLARIHFASARLRGSLRRNWRRIAVGAFFGWLVSTVLGAFALVALESSGAISSENAPLLGAGLVWGGVAYGALFAYAGRSQPERARPRSDVSQ